MARHELEAVQSERKRGRDPLTAQSAGHLVGIREKKNRTTLKTLTQKGLNEANGKGKSFLAHAVGKN